MTQNKRLLNKQLKQAGLGGLDDPNLIAQMAFCVRDHDHFRTILCAITPDQRTGAYEAMRPHLRFDAKPLDVYIAEAAERGANRESDKSPLDIVADRAIRRNELEAREFGGSVAMLCSVCTFEQVFVAKNPRQAAEDAREVGWDMEAGRIFCPECDLKRRKANRA